MQRWTPKIFRWNWDSTSDVGEMFNPNPIQVQSQEETDRHEGIPIPTTEDIRHKLEGSDHFSTLDVRDTFHHFLLSKESKDEEVYHFLVLVMGMPQALGECHMAMSKIMTGL